jgi:hypothetical protein
MRPEVLRRQEEGSGMPGILYRCVFCDVSHEVTKRADGPVYLRCPTTYRWAWYDARAFDAARPARGAGRATKAAAAAGARRRRPASGGRRAPASTRAKATASRRAGRKAAGRPASRKRAGKRGRR